ncbi:MAG: nucleoside-diphosphate sugar epimerase/dehydratase [Chloroflexota bacterium]
MRSTMKFGMVSHQFKHVLESMILDVIIIQLAYAAAFFVRAASTPLDYVQSITFIGWATITLIVALYFFGVYYRLWSMTSGHDVSVIVKAVLIATLFIALADALQQERPVPVSVAVFGNILALGGFVAVRYRSRLITGVEWRWQRLRGSKISEESLTKVLIIGAGVAGQELALRLKHRSPNNYQAYKIVGFIDDDKRKQGLYVEGCPVIGTRSDIPRLADAHQIDLLVVAIHNILGPEFRDILNFCEKTHARIKIAPDVFALMNAKQGSALLRDIQVQDLIGRGPLSRHEGIDLSLVMTRRVLVTGAAGSIGSELCRQLCLNNLGELTMVDNNESSLHELAIELASKFPNIKFHPALVDITIKPALEAVFTKYQPQIVFHAAAYKHVPMLEYFPGEALRVNVGGTRLLAEMARDFKVERFVLISTDKAVNPSSIMGASKRACELIVRALSQQSGHRTLFTAVRFGNVLGSRGSVVPTFNAQIDSGGPVAVTHRDMTRYFMSIPEAANLVIHAACLTKGGDVFLLRMGEVVRIVDLAERMIRLRGLRPYKDIAIEFTGTRPGEKLFEELYTDSEVVIDTIHPDIVQPQSKNTNFDGEEFLGRVEKLLQSGLDKPSRMMELIAEDTAIEVSVPNLDRATA